MTVGGRLGGGVNIVRRIARSGAAGEVYGRPGCACLGTDRGIARQLPLCYTRNQILTEGTRRTASDVCERHPRHQLHAVPRLPGVRLYGSRYTLFTVAKCKTTKDSIGA